MSRAFTRNCLQRARAARRWKAHGAKVGIDPFNDAMDIRCEGRTVRSHGRVVVEDKPGSLQFVPELGESVSGFAGWMPCAGKAWLSAPDKWTFKEFAADANLRAPAWTTNPSGVKGTNIVKARRSTFGRGLRGPYSVRQDIDLSDGKYAEQFIAGELLKAWFWNAQPAAVEIVDRPRVREDGLRTMRQPFSAKLAPTDPWPSDLECLAAAQGVTLDAVIPSGKSLFADYRYVSVLNPFISIDHNDREQFRGLLWNRSCETRERRAGRPSPKTLSTTRFSRWMVSLMPREKSGSSRSIATPFYVPPFTTTC